MENLEEKTEGCKGELIQYIPQGDNTVKCCSPEFRKTTCKYSGHSLFIDGMPTRECWHPHAKPKEKEVQYTRNV